MNKVNKYNIIGKIYNINSFSKFEIMYPENLAGILSVLLIVLFLLLNADNSIGFVPAKEIVFLS